MYNQIAEQIINFVSNNVFKMIVCPLLIKRSYVYRIQFRALGQKLPGSKKGSLEREEIFAKREDSFSRHLELQSPEGNKGRTLPYTDVVSHTNTHTHTYTYTHIYRIQIYYTQTSLATSFQPFFSCRTLRRLSNRQLQHQQPVLKTFQVAPNSFFKISKERVRSDLRRLKNRLLESGSVFSTPRANRNFLCVQWLMRFT